MQLHLENMHSIDNMRTILYLKISVVWSGYTNIKILVNDLVIKIIWELHLCIPELSTFNFELNIPTHKMRESIHVKALVFHLFLHVPPLDTIENEPAHMPEMQFNCTQLNQNCHRR